MFVKICCISSLKEAEMAIAAGASAIGLVGPMPSGPGIIDDELIAEIASMVDGVETFLLTSETSPDKILTHHQRVKTSTIQLVDTPEPETYPFLRKKLPSVRIVQVIHVIDQNSVDEAVKVSDAVDFILLDSGNPNLETKELGGTGRTHNWELSREIVRKSHCPVVLAGGLNPENVAEAINTVEPFGLDLCSGVRVRGNLSQELLEGFMDSTEEAKN